MSEIKILDIALDDGEMTSTVYTVEVDGTSYKVDEWSTHNSCGIEIYDEEGKWTAEYPEALHHELENDFLTEHPQVLEFWRRYRDEVEPVIARIKREVFGTVEEAVTE